MDIVSSPRHFPTLAPLLPQGIPQSSIIAITGLPGSGKTTFCGQLMFQLPKELPYLWFSAFSEPQNALIAHLKSFSFFKRENAGRNIDLASLFTEDRNFEDIFQIIQDSVEKYDVKVVFIDSYRQIAQWAKASNENFTKFSKLPSYFAMRGITTFLIGEYSDEDLKTDTLFGLVDGIINLKFLHEGYQRQRYIEVQKMRGVEMKSGLHPVRITKDGYNIYPQEFSTEVTQTSSERIQTGLTELDEMLNGGLFRFAHTMVRGPSGTGKTVLGMHFLNEGIKREENVLFYATEQWEEDIIRAADSIGINFTKAKEDKRLTIATPKYANASYEEILEDIKHIILEKNISRIFIDSLSVLQKRGHVDRFQNFLASLQSFTKQRGIPILSSMLSKEITKTESATDIGISSAIDSIIFLKYVEIQGEMHRGIMVFKLRGSDHDKAFHEYNITNNGMVIGQKFSGIQGLLSGEIRNVGPTTAEKIKEILNESMGVIGEKVYEEIASMRFNPERISEYFNDLADENILSVDDSENCKKQLLTELSTS